MDLNVRCLDRPEMINTLQGGMTYLSCTSNRLPMDDVHGIEAELTSAVTSNRRIIVGISFLDQILQAEQEPATSRIATQRNRKNEIVSHLEKRVD
jgi:hypothetical protein